MYTYESSEQGDLSFQQGDVVMVTRKEGDWWTGMVGGKTGVFPSNYVKPRDSASDVRAHTEHVCLFFFYIMREIFMIIIIKSLCAVFGTSGEDRQSGEETR